MKIRVEFGVPATKIREVKWYDDVLKMPRVVKFKDEFWEWIAYDSTPGKDTEYVLTYGKVVNQGQYVGFEVPNFDEMFSWQHGMDVNCECGSAYDRHFPNNHSHWCPKWGRE